MTALRRLALAGALLLASNSARAQVVERPVPFDAAGTVMVITPFIAERAALRAPWWPVSGDFTEARLFTVNDSSYTLAVTRRTGVVERYTLSPTDRDAIRAIVSKLPREVVEPRRDAHNAFIRNQTLLGLIVYGPTFAAAIGDNAAGATAGYLVVAGGTFFAASEISRRVFITKPMTDLSTNLGHNAALAGWATMYLFGASDRAQAAGAFIGGIGGAALGVGWARKMTEADAIGAGFGANISALLAWGAMEGFQGDEHCEQQPDFTVTCSGERFSDKTKVALILGTGLIGYPLGLLYPRNARYNVTPGDIQTLYATTGLGASAALTLVPQSASGSTAAISAAAGGVVGLILGDAFLVRRYDHGRGDASKVTLGTLAGGLMGLGVAALIDSDLENTHLAFGMITAGGLIGLLASEHYADAGPDAGRRAPRLSFNPHSILLAAARTPGNHPLLTVRF